MIDSYEQYKRTVFAPMQVLQQRSYGIHDIAVLTCDIPFWSDSLTDTTVIFSHQGIVSATLVDVPRKHFYIKGYLEAVQNCIDWFAIARMMHHMNHIWESQAHFAAKNPPAHPKEWNILKGPEPQVSTSSPARRAIRRGDQESFV
jgi:hypothetical protein